MAATSAVASRTLLPPNFMITRGEGAEVAYPASQAVKVLPGDVVRVPERFF